MIIFPTLTTILLFALFALYSCKTCMEEKLDQCLEKSLHSRKMSVTKSEIYAELQNCYRDAQLVCGDVYLKDGTEYKYCYLDDLGNEQCVGSEQKYDTQSCVDEYMGYLAGCATEVVGDGTEIILGKGRNNEMIKDHIDRDDFKCGAGIAFYKCFLERAEEKCGKAGREFVVGEAQKGSNDLLDSCKKANPSQVHVLEMILLNMQQEEKLETLKE